MDSQSKFSAHGLLPFLYDSYSVASPYISRTYFNLVLLSGIFETISGNEVFLLFPPLELTLFSEFHLQFIYQNHSRNERKGTWIGQKLYSCSKVSFCLSVFKVFGSLWFERFLESHVICQENQWMEVTGVSVTLTQKITLQPTELFTSLFGSLWSMVFE